MELTGLHLLLTYQCTQRCDHCFVWGSPSQRGTMTLEQVGRILAECRKVESIATVYFEGGEPFLYYPLLLEGVKRAAALGLGAGVVTNGYWATSLDDARLWLRPLAGLAADLSVSSDLYHGDREPSAEAQRCLAAAVGLGIPAGTIRVAQPEEADAALAEGQLPRGTSRVMYRGRAAVRLAGRVPLHPAERFTECPGENLDEPGRLHVDPFGDLHLCQGIVVGNLFRTPLEEICRAYRVEDHPVAGPLHEGGPAALARRHGLEAGGGYGDACHLCYHCRLQLRGRFPDLLGPDQMYGAPDE